MRDGIFSIVFPEIRVYLSICPIGQVFDFFRFVFSMAVNQIKHKQILMEEFNAAAQDVLADIFFLGLEIADGEREIRGKTIGPIGKHEESGPFYSSRILDYIEGLKSLSVRFNKDIFLAAGRISGLAAQIQPDRQEIIDPIWLSLTLALEPLGLRPSKKFSAIAVDENQQLVCWSVVRLYPGLEEKADYYIKKDNGGRGRYMQCAERAVLADISGFRGLGENERESGMSALEYASLYQKALREITLRNDQASKYTLYSGHFPCLLCHEALTKNDGKELVFSRLVTQWNENKIRGFTAPYRNVRESYRRFVKAGLPVSVLKPAL